MPWFVRPKKDAAAGDIIGEMASNLRSDGFRME